MLPPGEAHGDQRCRPCPDRRDTAIFAPRTDNSPVGPSACRPTRLVLARTPLNNERGRGGKNADKAPQMR